MQLFRLTKNASLSDTLRSVADIPNTPIVDECIHKHEQDTHCCTLTTQLRNPNTKLLVDYHELFLRRLSVDHAIQMLVPITPRQQIVALAHNHSRW